MIDFEKLLCSFNRHAPNKRSAVWDGVHFVGTCRRCGTRIYRVRSKVWRELGPEG